jgi:prepilin signal peptidase PulO-like enzyme (type II secretory pathway)
MSLPLALLVGALLGVTAGSLLVPLTRRELTAAVARAVTSEAAAAGMQTHTTQVAVGALRIGALQRLALAAASGVVPAVILARVGWSLIALPPLLMLVGLVQLAYCDLTRRLLPKTLVFALGVVVATAGAAVAASMPAWGRLVQAGIGAAVMFAVFFAINLMNPRWIAYGDVRLSLVVGFGLAWVNPAALLDGFFYANLLAAVVGLVLLGLRRATRGSAMPFGLYLTVASALVLVMWS